MGACGCVWVRVNACEWWVFPVKIQVQLTPLPKSRKRNTCTERLPELEFMLNEQMNGYKSCTTCPYYMLLPPNLEEIAECYTLQSKCICEVFSRHTNLNKWLNIQNNI